MDEIKLIEQCMNGDSTSQKLLFEKYGPKMLAVCVRYARHRLEAEDIFQEAFIKVFNKLHQFENRGSLEFWIKRIMINTAIKYLKKSAVKNELIGLDELPETAIQSDAISQMSEQELLKVINTLPDGYRMVFNMYAIEGMNHKEIADELGIGESTSRSQLVKARKLLQSKIIELQKVYL